MSIFLQFWKLLEPKEKLQAVALFICMLISACLELLGIGLIIPVIALLAKPELMDQNKYLKLFKAFINPSSDKNFVILLGILIIALFIFKNLFLALQTFFQARFVLGKGARISSKLFDTYIHAPYKFHLDNNSGTLMSKLGIGSNICASVLMPAMIVSTEFLVLLFILVMLLTLSPIVTLSLIVFCGIMFAIFHFPLQNLNLSIGKKYYLNQVESGKITLQGLHAVKDSKIMNVEDFFTEMYSRFQNRNKNLQSLLIFINNSPRFFIEAFVVCTGMTTILILMTTGKELSSILMILSLFAVSLVRIMPSLSRIQYNLSNIKQHQSSFEFVSNDLKNIEREDKSAKIADIKFSEKIEIKNLVFSYNEKSPKIFDGFNLEIPYKSSIAFVGPTGCGKTTLVDIILGLLKPNFGEILVDGVNIEMNLPAWQKKIGYVPQFIFLLDDTIKANVAFGLPPEKIDENRVRECLKIAQIWDFVDSLPDKINTTIGENGIKLSGGQRQRIGIARALYHNPEVLVLDEATSALDNDTEKAFIDALKTLHGKLTIIIVAHRLTTVQNCDRILKII